MTDNEYDWEDILSIMYNEIQGPMAGWPGNPDERVRGLTIRLGFGEENEEGKFVVPSPRILDVRKTLITMAQVGLLHEEETDSRPPYSLTKKGFEVAHDREQNRRQHEVNRAIGYLTSGLLLVAFIQVIFNAAPILGLNNLALGAILIMGGLGLVYLMYDISQSGLLSPLDDET